MEDGHVCVDMGPPILKAADVPTTLGATQVCSTLPTTPSSSCTVHSGGALHSAPCLKFSRQVPFAYTQSITEHALQSNAWRGEENVHPG
jgi:hypothetical protein